MEIPRVPLNFNQQSDRSFDEYMNKGPIVSSEDASSAAWDLGFRDTAMMLGARLGIVNEFENSGVSKITPEEANTRYPNMSVPFREPVNPYFAQLKYDQEQEKNKLAYKIANGPDDAWTKTKVFGAGMLAHLMDPIEFGAGAFIGWGVGGLAGAGAFGARAAGAARAIEAGTAGVGTRIGFNAVREGVGNLIQNVGQEGVQGLVEAREGFESERTGAEVLTDIGISTFAATALGTGVAEGAYQLKGLKRMLRNTSPEADLAVARATMSALETELRPDTTPILNTLAKETSVLPQDYGKAAYHFEPVTPETIKGRTFYAATRDAVPSLDGQRVPLGDDFGFGTHITDNPGVANAAAARSMADSVGAVHAVELGDLRPLSLDAPIPEGKLREGLRELLESVDFEDAGKTLETESARDILTYIRNADDAGLVQPGTLEKVQAMIKDEGYNALQSDGTKHMGVDHEAHNHLTILDDTLLSHKKSFQPDPAVIRSPTKEELDAVVTRNTDPKQQVFANPEGYAQNLERLKEVPQVTRNDTAAIRSETESLLQEFAERQKQGLFTEADMAEVKALREGLQTLEDEHTFLKAFSVCVRG